MSMLKRKDNVNQNCVWVNAILDGVVWCMECKSEFAVGNSQTFSQPEIILR